MMNAIYACWWTGDAMQGHVSLDELFNTWGRDKMPAISQTISLNENFWILTTISLKYVP